MYRTTASTILTALLRPVVVLIILAPPHAPLYSQSDMTAGAGAPYNTELGLSGSFTSLPGASGSGSEYTAIGVDAYHSFRLLVQDAATPTAASKAVLPKSWIGGSLTYGPLFESGPDRYGIQAAGAGMITSWAGLGGALRFSHGRLDRTWKEREFLAGVFLDIYASRGAVLREFFGYGTVDVDPRSYDIFRYEHMLSVTGGADFGYTHELLLHSFDDSWRTVDFNQYFEIASSPEFSVVPQLRLNVYIPKYGDASTSLGLGFGLQFLATPRVLLQFTPVYSFNVENTSADAFSIMGRMGVRM
ncbi:MAG: hypothetical protein IH600_15770 [Bacteroidetes bacterium]|nr:hypothetical protein [Bacteroidota bacterium]